MSVDFNPRHAALNHAGRAGELTDVASSIACGLVYVGDKIDALRFQLGQDAAAADQVDRTGMPSASKSVKVVALGSRTALLEVDGVQRQLFAGETLTVSGLTVTTKAPVVDAEVISAEEDRFRLALQAIRDYQEDFGSGPADDDMRAIAIRALEGESAAGPVKLSRMAAAKLSQVAEPDEMPTADARLLEARGDSAMFSLGGSVWGVRVGEVFRLVADVSGRFRVATESQLEREEYRAFLRAQAEQVPDGVKATVRELVGKLTSEPGGEWRLGGSLITAPVRDLLFSLSDWCNQLDNIEREVSE